VSKSGGGGPPLLSRSSSSSTANPPRRLGITKQGRVACLTNFRETGQAPIEGARSRGAIVNAYLRTPASSAETTAQAAARLIADGVAGVGGFSLLLGHLRRRGEDDDGLAVVSNRCTDVGGVQWLLRGGAAEAETHALSNSFYGDRSWRKVVEAEGAVAAAVKALVAERAGPDDVVQACLRVLSADTLPRQRPGESWEVYLNQLRNSIFVPLVGLGSKSLIGESATPSDSTPRSASPAVGQGAKSAAAMVNGVVGGDHHATDATSGTYGTQKQSVILVDNEGKVTFFERTLFDMNGSPIKLGEGDRKFEFQIEGW